MTRFLKRAESTDGHCGGCVFDTRCLSVTRGKSPRCGRDTFILVPRPPDGTRCRDLDGKIKIVGKDV